MIIGPLTSPSSPSVKFTALDEPIITNIINTKKSAGVMYRELFFIMGFTINIINSRRMKEIDYLLENGVCLRATVDSVTIGNNRFKNIKNRKVICTYEEGGQKYIFKSDSIYRQVENNIHKGDSINVYANPEEYKKYYVYVKE